MVNYRRRNEGEAVKKEGGFTIAVLGLIFLVLLARCLGAQTTGANGVVVPCASLGFNNTTATWCYAYTTGTSASIGPLWNPPAPREPLSVPAVQETHEEEYGNADWCNTTMPVGGVATLGGQQLMNHSAMYCDPHAKHKVTHWVCEDKRRTREGPDGNGKWHCVLYEDGK